MALGAKRRVKSLLVRIRPELLVLALVVLLAASAVAAAVLDAAHQPPPSRATVQSLDAAVAAAMSADPQGLVDSDHDGLSDTLENFVYGTDPHRFNTSGSRIPDGWLVQHGLDAFDPTIETRAAATPSFDQLPPAYHGQWPAAFTPTLWQIYSYGRPANWSEETQGAFNSRLDPTTWDTNGDGIADGYLLHYDLDALDAKIGDERLAGSAGLTVREAFDHSTNPRLVDSDGDGLSDRMEIEGATAANGLRLPASDPSRFDSSGTGVCDGYLAAHGLDPSKPADALGDLDHDGASTRDEYNWSVAHFGVKGVCSGSAGLDPTKAHSGSSTIPDGWLVHYGLNPFDSGIDQRVTQSSDTDLHPTLPPEPSECPSAPVVKLTVHDEYNHSRPPTWNEAVSGPWWGGTNPTKADTDGDGLGDSLEERGFCISVVLDPVANKTKTYRAPSDPTRADTDGDGLDDAHEVAPSLRAGIAATMGALDPSRRDTDFDGIPDGTEVTNGLGLDPARADSAGDLLMDGQRLAMLTARSEQAGASPDAAYAFGGVGAPARTLLDVAQSEPGWANATGTTSAARIKGLWGPGGDVDGDGVPNILDKDIDGDGLLNGWELQPSTYQFSSFGLGPFQSRPSTDALNPDTDGDLLRDGWEVTYGVPDLAHGRFNLDPSQWDSDGNGIGDGNENPDHDSATWYNFEGSPLVAHKQVFEFTNLKEQQYGTDPNKFDTDGDGLADGWKVFWSLVYPTPGAVDVGLVYPGAPGPLNAPAALGPKLHVKGQGDVPLQRVQYDRFLVHAPPDDSTEVLTGAPVQTGGHTIYHMVGTATFGFLEEQQAGTNPYMAGDPASTDGDLVPDAWEWVHAAPITDPDLVGNCVSGPAPDPVRPDAAADPDGDQLSNQAEFQNHGDPLCPDTDLGGIKDGAEIQFGSLSLVDPADDADVIQHSAKDSDCDGVPDAKELAGFTPAYMAHPVQTDPHNPDTDGDGLLDGGNVPASGGLAPSDPCAAYFLDLGIAYQRLSDDTLVFFGEEGSSSRSIGGNPLDPDDAHIGIPGGWLAAHNLPLDSSSGAYRPFYEFGIPSWWDTRVHGPWWGGADPNTTGTADPQREDLDKLAANPDPDGDGLIDHDGLAAYEDPLPWANGLNQYRDLTKPPSCDRASASCLGIDDSVTYPAPGLDPSNATFPRLERRLEAQGLVNQRGLGDFYEAYQRPTPVPRETPCITLDDSGTLQIVKGTPRHVTGRVFRCGLPTHPFPGITVEARMGEPQQVFGAAVTNDAGSFDISLNVSNAASIDLPANALVFRGATQGHVAWAPDPSAVVPGSNVLVVRTYSTPRRSTAFLTAPEPPLGSQTAGIGTVVRSVEVVQAAVAPFVVTGKSFDFNLREADSGGTPLADPITVTWHGASYRLRPDDGGHASVILPAPDDYAGSRTIHVTTAPGSATQDFVSAADQTFSLQLRNPIEIRLDPTAATADAGQTVDVRGTVVGPLGVEPDAALDVSLKRAGTTLTTSSVRSDAAGRFAAALEIPPNVVHGHLLIAVDAVPSSTVDAAHNESAFHVRDVPHFIEVEQGNLTLGTPAVVAARLVQPDGAGIPGATVTVVLGKARQNVTTTDLGGFDQTIGAPVTRGLVDETLTFAADAEHTAAQEAHQRLVLAASGLDLQSGQVSRGDAAEIRIRLTDAAGAPVPGAPISVQWGADPARIAVTNDEGVCSVLQSVPASAALGPVPVLAHYGGARDGTIGPSSAVASWNVTDGLLLDVADASYTAGDPTPTGTLLDPVSRSPLAGLTVWLDHEGIGSPVNITTDAAGRFPLEPSSTNASLPFHESLHVRFEGTPQYGPAEKTVDVVMRSPVSLRAVVSRQLVAGSPATTVVDLVDGGGRAVLDGTITIQLAGTNLTQAPPADGDTRLPLTPPADLAPGPATLEFDYSGSPIHERTTATVPVRILSPITLTFKVERALAGHQATVVAEARQGNSTVSGVPLSLNVAGLPAGLEAETDARGQAVFRLPMPAATTPIALHFTGNGTASAAAATGLIEPLSVSEVIARHSTGFIWALQAGALVLGILSFLAYRLRRHPLVPSLGKARRALLGRGAVETRILRAYQILQDAAISAEIIDGPANTPGALGEGIRPRVSHELEPALDTLIAKFEEARYGRRSMDESDRGAAIASLDALIDGFARFNPIWRKSVGTDLRSPPN